VLPETRAGVFNEVWKPRWSDCYVVMQIVPDYPPHHSHGLRKYDGGRPANTSTALVNMLISTYRSGMHGPMAIGNSRCMAGWNSRCSRPKKPR